MSNENIVFDWGHDTLNDQYWFAYEWAGLVETVILDDECVYELKRDSNTEFWGKLMLKTSYHFTLALMNFLIVLKEYKI